MGEQARSVLNPRISRAGAAWTLGLLLAAAALLAAAWRLWPIPPFTSIAAPIATASPPRAPTPAGGFTEEDEILRILGLLQETDPKRIAQGVQTVRQIAIERPRMLAEGLPKWLTYLLDARDFEDVENFSAEAIEQKPQGMPAVSEEQRGRVAALLAEGKNDLAVPAAKSYFNVATLAATSDAIDLLSQALKNPPGEPLDRKALDAIVVDDSQYEPAMQRLRDKHESYGSMVGLGNLLLLADRPVEAKSCFERGCVVCGGDDEHLRVALEGVARAIRAISGGGDAANAFVTALQRGDRSGLTGDMAGLDADQLVRVSKLIDLAESPVGREPPIEAARLAAQRAGESPVQVETGFECSTPVEVTSISPTHLLVKVTTPVFRDWFMFRLHGLAGRTVRIDIKNDDGPLDKWWSLNPVYQQSAAENPADFEAQRAWNGADLPETRGQDWHYIAAAWMQNSTTFCFTQKFAGDDATIAMRVPYTPADNEAFFDSLAGGDGVEVIRIGRSRENRPLLLLQIGDANPTKPCVLIYAGEHADEHDAMWAARGAAEYLLAQTPESADLRRRCTWLVIPMLDPDSSYISRHEGIIISFLMSLKTPESIAYANWFQAWANAGNRLDVVFDLHNRQSHEGPDVQAALLESDGVRGAASLRLHELLMDRVAAEGCSLLRRPMQRGWSPDRLGGWLSRRFGPITLAYELNSMDPQRHLNVKELSDLGGLFAQSAADFLASPDSGGVLADIDRRRAARAYQWAHYVPAGKNEDAIVSETYRTRITLPPENALLAADDNWVP
ncbi:MAG: M14 family zinc carboxypeptidase [Tepidisphaeraceae bacterium]|jgi:hypothetical protein